MDVGTPRTTPLVRRRDSTPLRNPDDGSDLRYRSSRTFLRFPRPGTPVRSPDVPVSGVPVPIETQSYGPRCKVGDRRSGSHPIRWKGPESKKGYCLK